MNSKLLSTIALSAFATLCFAGSSSRLASLDLSLEKATSARTYRVSLEPPQPEPAINQIHSWTVRVSDVNGSPVHDAAFAITGGMPEHGHGLPTRPRVTRELGQGTYLLDGMKFSMPGWWVITLSIQAPEGTDTVSFNTIVQPRRRR